MTADAFFLQYRPSSIAMAAVLVVVNELFDVQTDFPSFDDALDDLYSPSHIAEVATCSNPSSFFELLQRPRLGSTRGTRLFKSISWMKVTVQVSHVWMDKSAVYLTR